MIKMEQIIELNRRIVEEFEPERVILFGSHAYGTPTDASDVDVLVILPFEGKEARKALEIARRVRPEFPVDILARTPEKVRQRLEMNDLFLKTIMEKGTVLHDTVNSGVGG